MKGNREMTGSENSDLRTVLFVYHSAAQTRPHLLSEPSILFYLNSAPRTLTL